MDEERVAEEDIPGAAGGQRHRPGGAGPGRELGRLLLSMSYADPDARPLLDLEGLTRWLAGRDSGYGLLEAGVALSGFYDESGRVTAAAYRP